jgi:hypothetical protein
VEPLRNLTLPARLAFRVLANVLPLLVYNPGISYLGF